MAVPVLPIAKLLLSFGPTILRRFGKSKGGITATVADSVADIIEGNEYSPKEEQTEQLSKALKYLPPDQATALFELQVELEKVRQEGAWKELEHSLGVIRADTEARVAELHQSDVFTKQTRPRIARQSWYVAAAYALSNIVGPAYLTLAQRSEVWPISFEWSIFVALAAPALTYMGVRGFEKWKGGGIK